MFQGYSGLFQAYSGHSVIKVKPYYPNHDNEKKNNFLSIYRLSEPENPDNSDESCPEPCPDCVCNADI